MDEKTPVTFHVTHSEAEPGDGGVAWPGAERQQHEHEPHAKHVQLTTTSTQVKLHGLRAGVGYHVRVAASAGERTSEWALSNLLRTAGPDHTPDPPLAPIVLGGEADGICKGPLKLRLPPPQGGCRSPVEASLQLAHAGAASSPWTEYFSPITSSDTLLEGLHPNSTYRFRLVGHNDAGKSHPGSSTPEVKTCAPGMAVHPDPAAAAAAVPAVAGGAVSTGAAAGEAFTTEEATFAREDPTAATFSSAARDPTSGGEVPVWISAVFATVCALVAVGGACSFCSRLFGGVQRKYGYQRTPTKDRHHEGEDDELMMSKGAAAEPGMFAYDEWQQNLCVQVFVPSSTRPVTIEMSTEHIATTAALLDQLRVVVGEVMGRPTPIDPEDEGFAVVYEDESGVQVALDALTELRRVYVASRVVASVAGSRVSPALRSGALQYDAGGGEEAMRL